MVVSHAYTPYLVIRVTMVITKSSTHNWTVRSDSACKEEPRVPYHLTCGLEKYVIQRRTCTRLVRRLSTIIVYQRVSLCDSPGETLQNPSGFAVGRMPGAYIKVVHYVRDVE